MSSHDLKEQLPEGPLEAAMRAAYDLEPSWTHPAADAKRRPRTYEECYGCSPLERADDAEEMRVAIQAFLSKATIPELLAAKQGSDYEAPSESDSASGERRWTIHKQTGQWDDVIEGPDTEAEVVVPESVVQGLVQVAASVAGRLRLQSMALMADEGELLARAVKRARIALLPASGREPKVR